MNDDTRARLAKQLTGNGLLPLVMSEHAEDLRHAWEDCEDQGERERLWLQLKALKDFWDYLNAKLKDYSGDGRK